MTPRTFLGWAAMAATCLSAVNTRATEVLSTGYTFLQPTSFADYDYSDQTKTQLIDGEYGVSPWTADLGHGHAYEWLGWTERVIDIDFTFAGTQSIDEIRVGSVQDYVDDVVFPNVSIYVPDGLGGWTFVKSVLTPESSANNYQYRTIVLDNLGLNASSVRVTISQNLNGPWTFIDEVDFIGGSTSVPDSGSNLLLGSIAAIGLGLTHRRIQTSLAPSLVLIPVKRRR